MSCLRPAVLTVIAVSLVIGTAFAPPATSAADSSLERVVLRPSQVGPDYVMKVIPGGHAVHNQVTLDMCGFRFASENFRTGRLQAAYVRRGSRLAMSNEVVSYRPGGAAAAMREIVEAILTCPRGPVRSAIRGFPPMRYRITVLSPAGKSLLPGALAMKATVSGTLKGKHLTETSVIVYQRLRDTLSGVYVDGGTLKERMAMAFTASAQSALNLKHLR
jgi:hypothetical protein